MLGRKQFQLRIHKGKLISEVHFEGCISTSFCKLDIKSTNYILCFWANQACLSKPGDTRPNFTDKT